MRRCTSWISFLGNFTVYFVLFYVDTDVSEEYAPSWSITSNLDNEI